MFMLLFFFLLYFLIPQTTKKSRREAEMERKEAELKLSKLEAELMEPSARPESAEAFERLLLSSPDSSLLWLQYMAFQLQATQIEQARTVAERALKTISFRLVWDQYLIYIYTFGTMHKNTMKKYPTLRAPTFTRTKSSTLIPPSTRVEDWRFYWAF